jgi:hypothetical protein
MTNLVTLQEKVQAMLDGEKKRREKAFKFLDELQNILEEVAEDIWGTGDHREYKGSVWVRNKKNDKNEATEFYFRYIEYEGSNRYECNGFLKSGYDCSVYEYPLWGEKIKDLKGSNFWNAIRCIIGWIPILIETIDNRSDSRNKLIGLVNF